MDLGFELTNFCNLHCNHCIRGPFQEEVEELDLPFIRRVLDEAEALFGETRVILTGGEPLAAALFPAMVAELAARRLPWRMVTNGWHVPRHLPSLLAHRPELVRISLSGASEASHDRERGRHGFRRALLGVSTLLAHAIRTELSMVVTRESSRELTAAAELANRIGVAELHYILPQPTPHSALEMTDLGPAEWQAVAVEVLELSRRSPIPIRLDYGAYEPMPRPRCATLGGRQMYVDAGGRATFCCQLSRYGDGPETVVGDLRRESLAAIAARMDTVYEAFVAETGRRHAAGETDDLDEYPCLSCARRHGRTGFLANFPEHPWTRLAVGA